MKKLLPILLALCLALSLLPASALAADVIASGVGSDGLAWSFSKDGKLTVTGRGPMRNYDKSDIYMDENIDQRVPTPWAKYASQLKTVVIGEGVTEVGDYTFIDCRSVTDIQLPRTLRRVGQCAFGSASVTELTLPEGLQKIDRMAFVGLDITTLVIPASVREIGDHAFDGCDRMNVLWILGPVRSIEAGTFRACYGLTDVFLSAGIGSIHHNAFTGSTLIRDVYYGGSRDQFYEMVQNIYSELTRGTNRFHFHFTLNPYVSFADVPAGEWYSESVLWAAQRGITAGTESGWFSPDLVCTRAQMVTFLWRAMGSEDPFFPNENPFTDVSPADYYYKAVLWARERSIARGTSETTFSPNDTVTRAETVTFLCRACSGYTNAPSSAFADVSPKAYYYEAVRWAENDRVTSGVAPGVFGPDLPCTRAQIITFLQRAKP